MVSAALRSGKIDRYQKMCHFKEGYSTSHVHVIIVGNDGADQNDDGDGDGEEDDDGDDGDEDEDEDDGIYDYENDKADDREDLVLD